MNDLFSYNEKHNLENAEENRDGENMNYSYNYGIEGNDATPYIESIRSRQVKNIYATLFLSQGVPMILAGDEFRRTQRGNNNAYCQDNDISWINWKFLRNHFDVFRFVQCMIKFRMEHTVLRRKTFFSGKAETGRTHPDISWHGFHVGNPDWSENSLAIACLINGEYADISETGRDSDLFIAFNSSPYNHYFEIPDPPSGKSWLVKIDTSNESPFDFFDPGDEIPLTEKKYLVKRLSTVVLVSIN
jgi:isoamylase